MSLREVYEGRPRQRRGAALCPPLPFPCMACACTGVCVPGCREPVGEVWDCTWRGSCRHRVQQSWSPAAVADKGAGHAPLPAGPGERMVAQTGRRGRQVCVEMVGVHHAQPAPGNACLPACLQSTTAQCRQPAELRTDRHSQRLQVCRPLPSSETLWARRCFGAAALRTACSHDIGRRHSRSRGRGDDDTRDSSTSIGLWETRRAQAPVSCLSSVEPASLPARCRQA